MARAKRLRRVRNMANLTRDAMCAGDGLNINTYKGWEIARYGGLPVDGAEKVVKRVAREGVICTIDWLLHGRGVGPYVLPTGGRSQISTEVLIGAATGEAALIQNELALFTKQFSDTVYCQVQDDALTPFYNVGDYVAGVKYYGEQISDLIGQNCLVQTPEGEILVRHLRAGTQADRYTLVSVNAHTRAAKAFLFNVALISAAPIMRWYRCKLG